MKEAGMRKRMAAMLVLATLATAACGEATGSQGDGRVAVRFTTGGQAGVAAAVEGETAAAGGTLLVAGSNGTLSIQDVRLIVNEFELENDDHGRGGDDDDDDACDSSGRGNPCRQEFRAPPFLLELPLSGGQVTVATDQVPAGSYNEFKFKVEDLELDDDDHTATERQALQAILTQVRATYPAFPDRASMVVRGTFTPTGGAPRPFTVYFDAEIEVETELSPPLVVPRTASLTVDVQPDLWFRSGTQVRDLSALDGRTVEFEIEIERGFGRVEVERD
jgi:hypothetical protein